ncbi:MAG: cytochrome c [Cyanobacteria bacterium]|nr:cytochrome c [Cyanobacteriota bacterium]
MKRRLAIALLVLTAACERERRDFKLPNGDHLTAATQVSQLQPGAPSPPPVVESPFQDNAYALSEGKRLYSAFNCVGCHAQGGGAIGPALMDHRWIYGSRPDQIFSTIVQGRPNGMPSFAGKIPDQQVWQLVAYVQSMSGNVPKDAAPARNDDMQASKPELRREPKPPVQTGHR